MHGVVEDRIKSSRARRRHRRSRRIDPGDAAGQVHLPDRSPVAIDTRPGRPRPRRGQPGLALQPRDFPGRPAGRRGHLSMCTFWYVEALARAGSPDQARLVFRKMLTYANHLGLYAEEIGLTGEQLGKLPRGLHAPRAHQRRYKPRPASSRAGWRSARRPVQDALARWSGPDGSWVASCPRARPYLMPRRRWAAPSPPSGSRLSASGSKRKGRVSPGQLSRSRRGPREPAGGLRAAPWPYPWAAGRALALRGAEEVRCRGSS